MPSTSTPEDVRDEVLANLTTYLATHKITHSTSLAFRRIPGKGIGIYSTARIPANTRIFHVPTLALLTTSSIPLSFASKDIRTKIPVHALLSAYLAFGMTEERRKAMLGWTDTWPKWDDFASSMPLFWPEGTRKPVVLSSHDSIEGLESQGRNTTFIPLPPTLTGTWLSPTPTPSTSGSGSSRVPLLDSQLKKLSAHLSTTAIMFPEYSTSLLDPTSSLRREYLYRWANINTRCFYHVQPGKRAPIDSNEAMALCPGMDLFNHSDNPTCRTSYDRRGFYVTTSVDIPSGEELLLSYGAHGNDLLWSEYGFVMDMNHDDHVAFDEIVLSTLSEEEKSILTKSGYLGNYSLTSQGVCWRTEVVSWLGILTQTQWFRFLEGNFTPETADRLFLDSGSKVLGKRRKGNQGQITADKDEHARNEKPTVRATRRKVTWVTSMRRRAEESICGLLQIADEASITQLIEIFTGESSVRGHQGQNGRNTAEVHSIANVRLGLSIRRWLQIMEMSHNELTTFETSPAISGDTIDHSEQINTLRAMCIKVLEQIN